MKNGSGITQVGEVLIRPMLSSDLDSVISIEELSFLHPWTRDQFMVELGREPISQCHVAVWEGSENVLEKGTIAGFIMAWLVVDELHINNLAVAPEARRNGIAAALLENSFREAIDLGAGWCQLEVRASNTPARGLYRRYGFKPLGKRKRYYLNGEDAVVMAKDLESSQGKSTEE